ncbi:UNVERIFIED_CONTAM: hypothetical protein Scaly_2022100 [Sesamum calycinum]|uniref:Uncharacterized protein n=1 Tax=Sesamum calycinum TaxID=2727403 RepID=A0AAW2N161_9LAMI
MLKLFVVDAPSSYNIIMGRSSLNSFRVISSTYHMKLKFPTYRGIGEEKGDCHLARECHANILKQKSKSPYRKKNSKQKREKYRGDPRPCPTTTRETRAANEEEKNRRKKHVATKELKDVQVVEDEPGKTTSIGKVMEQKMEEKLMRFLKTNSDVFAWTVHDLVRIDPEVITHKLIVNPTFRPVRQKKRNFGPERNEIIKKEVEKLLTIGYVCPVQYPKWLTNVVLVPKLNKKWMMCIDFTYLNRACPKDSYPL